MNTRSNPVPASDAQLVARHLAGDPQAFRLIVERHQGTVCAIAYSACGDVTRSEDVAQEVFVAAWRQLPQLREPAKLRGWLGGIARNLAHNSLRRAGRTPTMRAEELPADAPTDAPGPREHAIGADEAGLMWDALGGLPEAYREPMVLFYREGRSVAAVAAALEISEDAVKQRLARGRAMLTERMAKLVEETLERSAPTPVFATTVLTLLPASFGPALVETLTGDGAAAGRLTAAGALGSAAAKGGLALKILSTLVFLPVVMQGAEDFVRFQDRKATQADAAARRKAAWAYLNMHAGIGLCCLVGVGLPALIRDHTSPWILVPFALLLAAVMGFAFRAGRRMKALIPRWCSAGPQPGFVRRSAGGFLGLPFYHVRLGTRASLRAPAVKAWIAVSDGVAMGGLFAFGRVACAPVSLGLGSVGLLSIGVLALGGGALGVAAAGGLSTGLVALGTVAAKGIVAAAPLVASHHATFGGREGAEVAREFFQHHWFYRFSTLATGSLVWAGLLGWVLPLFLTAWQLWRTRRDPV